MLKSIIEIGGFDNASDCVRFLRFAGSAFALRAPRPDPTRVIGCKLMAGGDAIGTVVMLRKGVTIRINANDYGARRYIPGLLDAAAQWAARPKAPVHG